MKKIVSAILVLTMILTLTACNSKGSTTQTSGTGDVNSAQESDTAATNESTATEPVTIQFWNSFTGSDGDILREIVDEFNKKNTYGITIEMDIMSSENLSQKLPAAIATETAPALVLMSPADMVSYTESESLVDLSDFFESSDCDKTDFNETALELFQYEGKQMLIPMQIQSTYFYWNKDLFEAAGLDPEVPPKTWDEVADYAVKLTDSSKNQYGFGMPVSGAPTWFNAMFLAKGGSAVDLETKKSTLNSKENLEVLQYIQDLTNKGVTPQGATGTDTDNLLYAGKLAMYVNGPWVISGLKEAGINFGISLMPEDVCILDGMGFAVTKGTSAEAISAAYKFIANWNTLEVCKKWSLENGFPPYLKSLADDADILADDTLSVTANMVNIGKTWLSGLNVASKIDSEILFPMIEAVESGADPADTLKKSSDYIDELLSAY